MKTKPKPFKPDYRKVEVVVWDDAVADGSWEDAAKAEIHECITVGFLIDETDKAVCIASTVSRQASNARMSIPKAWIKSRKKLPLLTPKKKGARKNAPAEQRTA